MNTENETITLEFPPAHLRAIKAALEYAITNPYNAPALERTLYEAKAKIALALKRQTQTPQQ